MINLITFQPALLGPVLLTAAVALAGPTVYAAEAMPRAEREIA